MRTWRVLCELYGQIGIVKLDAVNLALFEKPLLFSWMVAAPLVWADDGYVRQPAFDLLAYDLTIALSDTSNRIQGEAAIQFVVKSLDDPVLELDLKEMMVRQVRLHGAACRYQHRDGVLALELPAEIAAGETLTAYINYAGVPADGLIIGSNKFKERTFFSDNWPDRASYWFPGIDHPSDKARVTFRIQLPAHYTVVANGMLQNVIDHGESKTWHWQETAPLPTYCMVFAAADFAVVAPAESKIAPISYFVYKADAPHAYVNLGRVPAMLEFFTQKIGPFPYSKLALVQSTTRFGGMENASAIFLAENSFGAGKSLEGTVAHEIAHQWFGDSVTESDWHHLWLSEGFATYGESLFAEHVDGVARMRATLDRHKQRYLRYAQQNASPVVDTNVGDYMQLLNPNNYQKGAWVLHMLRQVIGDSLFWASLRTFYSRFRDATALSEDFVRIVNSVGGQDYSWFFEQWLEQPGFPQLAVSWHWEAGKDLTVIELHQMQQESSYRLPIELALELETGQEMHSFWMNERQMRLSFPTERRPKDVVVDPEGKLLATSVVEAK